MNTNWRHPLERKSAGKAFVIKHLNNQKTCLIYRDQAGLWVEPFSTNLSIASYTRISNRPLLSVVAFAISCWDAACMPLVGGLAGGASLVAVVPLLWELCCEIWASICLICCCSCFVVVSLVFSSSLLDCTFSNSASSFVFCFSNSLVLFELDEDVDM